jgi:hypothetical protein
MILITLTFEKKPKSNQPISIFKWGTFNYMACNVIIHKQYIYGLTISRFCNDLHLLIILQNHNVKWFKIEISKAFSRWHGSTRTFF